MISPKDKGSRRSTGPFRRLLVTDLDGTMVDRSDRISKATSDSIEGLISAGWDVMVATGRTLSTSLSHMESLGSDLPAVVYDGGRVMDRNGRALWERTMDRELALAILSAGWEYGLEVQVMGDEIVFCRPQDVKTMAFFDRTGLSYSPMLTDPIIPEGEIFRVMFFDPTGSLAGAVSRDLRRRFEGTTEVVLAGDGFVDVLPQGVSKGKALERWLDFSEIKYHTIVAVGDNENDLELLKFADMAVAVSSAPEDLLSVAHWVVPPPEEDGPSVLVRRLLDFHSENLKYI
ncbi:HAD family hydrolase [Dethiosulfovibrio salsuginis]|uniref:Uncharacterized protein n=1 Tax=Dethiosulfovibrio salsuginis TaxID=561720 RepID=A0A1X7IU59_9BACT|nr:HAD family hydrolase [Dethiosulfovibrio salsuginis]SMG18414.1 hypothetical protein SAMN06275492_10527 [Dethiosulfovibrio salsuginis]